MILIVGAGIAGLYLANLLAKQGKRVVVIERRSAEGGRCRTVYKHDKVLFEEGPWRVHDSHHRVKDICAHYGLHLERTSSSLVKTPGEHDSAGHDSGKAYPTMPGLSSFDRLTTLKSMRRQSNLNTWSF